MISFYRQKPQSDCDSAIETFLIKGGKKKIFLYKKIIKKEKTYVCRKDRKTKKVKNKAERPYGACKNWSKNQRKKMLLVKNRL